MAFEITPKVKVKRDKDGFVRQLRHPRQSFTPEHAAVAAGLAVAPATPRLLADEYVREVLPVYDLEGSIGADLNAAVGTEIADEEPRLRFVREKVLKNQATVSYAQTCLGLPVWEAGLTVRMQGDPLVITSSQSSVHHGIEISPPGPDASYLPGAITTDVLMGLLGLDPEDAVVSINETQLIVYQYDPNDRGNGIGPPEEDDEENLHVGAPKIQVPEIPDSIEAKRHYIVSQVLFTLQQSDFAPLNWGAFIEPETGAVLNLSVFVGCIDGDVYLRDPPTATGDPSITATSPAATLDAIRDRVPLDGLDPPDASTGDQSLHGNYVRVLNLGPPNTPPPTEIAPNDFSYSVPTDDFSAVNAYHHCDRLFRMMEEMGFDVAAYFDGTTFPVRVDHRSRFNSLDGNEVNAQAPGNTSRNGSDGFRFALASGGAQVGIAVDWRVVLHEFGHTIMWDNVNSPNFRFAHSAGDSLAAILNDPGSQALDPGRTFPWSVIARRHDRRVQDGWGWGGVRDDPLPVGNPFSGDPAGYIREQILSSTLFLAYRSIGGDHNDLQAQQFAARYMTFLIFSAVATITQMAQPLNGEEFADELMDSDLAVTDFEGQPGGAVHKVIRWAFEHQGAYQLPGAATPVVTAGAPRRIDVFIDDGRNGEYDPAPQFVATTTDIWNRHSADGGLTHQDPVEGTANFVYARVRNRGTEAAQNITAQAFSTDQQGDRPWPTAWSALQAGAAVTPGQIGSGGEAVVGPYEWQPQNDGLHALLVSVSADDDDSNAVTVNGPLAAERLAHFDNNVAIREVNVTTTT
jgi:hypothetical protein